MADKNTQWKEKYYDSLDDLERREKKWQSLEELFKQAISRLTLAAQGNSKNLDNDLQQLRKAIRKGKDNQIIQSILEEVSKEIIKLDKMEKVAPQGDAGFLSRIIEQMQLTGKAEKKSRQVLKELKAENPPEQNDLLKIFTTLLSDVVEQAVLENASNSKSADGGFLKQLFTTGKKATDSEENTDVNELSEAHAEPDTATVDTVVAKEIEQSGAYLPSEAQQESQTGHDISLNQEQLSTVVSTVQNVIESIVDGLDITEEAKQQLNNKVFDVKPTREIHVLLDDLKEILHDSGIMDSSDSIDHTDSESINKILEHNDLLIRLIEFLPLEDGVKEKAEQLKEDFSHGVSTEQLPQALKSIAGLIGKMRKNVQQEQKEFERFLKTLSGRLDEVDQYLQHNLIEYQQSYQNGLELDVAVKDQVKGIGDSVSSINNIEEMEQAVQLHLDKILGHIDLHREKEKQRVTQIKEKNEQLSTQLKQLEGETGKLRQQVVESQNKAMIDPLTQMPNRLAYDERIKQEYARWKRYHSPLIIIVWDIDYFKKVNDNYGHQAGDKVLKVVADLLQKNLRETDFVARYGGEEFVGLMPETSVDGGFVVAEKIRSAIEMLEFHYRGSSVKVTISCGISLFMENDSPGTAFNRADKALYQAKDGGRNRCVIAKNP